MTFYVISRRRSSVEARVPAARNPANFVKTGLKTLKTDLDFIEKKLKLVGNGVSLYYVNILGEYKP